MMGDSWTYCRLADACECMQDTAYHGVGKSGSRKLSHENEDKKPGECEPGYELQYEALRSQIP
jgi:hypothetical protein